MIAREIRAHGETDAQPIASVMMMKNFHGTYCRIFGFACSVSLLLNPAIAGVQIGQKVTGIRLADSAGGSHNLDEYAGKILVLEFWSFKCPVSLSYDMRMAALLSKYSGRGVSFLAVASNRNESPIEVRRNAENLKLPFPVLLDGEGLLADRLGATHSPSVMILDRSGVLRYRGAIDNNKHEGERGRIAYVEQALDAILAGQPVRAAETRPFGCSIRR
ncbi:MAG: thiol-disulfide oxidoreductase [Acidobacteria bacterium]|nr:thiol-disulfide oxidoreductase [Acidobacteriota bacterium]